VRFTRTALTLEAANPDYAPMVFKGPRRQKVSILGKVVGIVRRS
jgi:repressor LexA